MMIYGYARVSSSDQNLDRQLSALNAAKIDSIFTDKASGKNLQREGFEALLEDVEIGDTVIVVSMDRLSRSLSDLLNTVKLFGEKGVTVRFLKENIEIAPGNTSPISKLLLGIMGAVAEFERNLIRERQAEGIRLAKLRGVYKGRSPVANGKLELAISLIRDGVPKTKAAKKAGVGRTTLYKYMKSIETIHEEAIGVESDKN